MIIKIIVLMSLCAVIALRKHFKKRALFVFVLIVAICANIFIPAFEFFVRSESQNDRILDYISQINWHDSDLLKQKVLTVTVKQVHTQMMINSAFTLLMRLLMIKKILFRNIKIFIMSIFRTCRKLS